MLTPLSAAQENYDFPVMDIHPRCENVKNEVRIARASDEKVPRFVAAISQDQPVTVHSANLVFHSSLENT